MDLNHLYISVHEHLPYHNILQFIVNFPIQKINISNKINFIVKLCSVQFAKYQHQRTLGNGVANEMVLCLQSKCGMQSAKRLSSQSVAMLHELSRELLPPLAICSFRNNLIGLIGLRINHILVSVNFSVISHNTYSTTSLAQVSNNKGTCGWILQGTRFHFQFLISHIKLNGCRTRGQKIMMVQLYSGWHRLMIQLLFGFYLFPYQKDINAQLGFVQMFCSYHG